MMMENIHNLFMQILCSFMGTVAFAVLFNVPKKYYLCCGITGTAGWLVYRFAEGYTSAAVASFFGTLIVVLSSRILTVVKKCPITLFLVPGIFPLVPGAGIYYTTYALVTGQLGEAATRGLDAVKIAFAIVLGIVVVVSLPREAFQPGYWKQKFRLRRLRRHRLKKSRNS